MGYYYLKLLDDLRLVLLSTICFFASSLLHSLSFSTSLANHASVHHSKEATVQLTQAAST